METPFLTMPDTGRLARYGVLDARQGPGQTRVCRDEHGGLWLVILVAADASHGEWRWLATALSFEEFMALRHQALGIKQVLLSPPHRSVRELITTPDTVPEVRYLLATDLSPEDMPWLP